MVKKRSRRKGIHEEVHVAAFVRTPPSDRAEHADALRPVPSDERDDPVAVGSEDFRYSEPNSQGDGANLWRVPKPGFASRAHSNGEAPRRPGVDAPVTM